MGRFTWIRLFRFIFIGGLMFLLLWFSGDQPPHNLSEYIIQSIPTREKVVALTYDDGPHPVYTRQILDILDQYKVKATFFMIGEKMESHPEIVRDVLARGHVIANHTYSHPHDLEVDSSRQIRAELEKCERLIERISGKRGVLFRPPRGLIDKDVFTIVQAEGYYTILWTVSADHHDAPDPQKMAQRVLRYIRPGGIILAHDGRSSSHWKDVAATRIFVKELMKEGYRFVTVPELLTIRGK